MDITTPELTRDSGHHTQPGFCDSKIGYQSTAIAVLIMAFIGVAMWIAFSNTFTSVAETTDDLVGQIGS